MDVAALKPAGAVNRSAGQLRDGLAAARKDREIAGPLAMMAFVGTLTYEFETSLPVFAEQTLHAGVTGYSWLTTAFGAGAVAAGLLLTHRPLTGLARLVWVAAGYGIAMTLLTVSTTLHVAVAAARVVVADSLAVDQARHPQVAIERREKPTRHSNPASVNATSAAVSSPRPR